MTEFIVQEDGLLAESSVHELAAWYASLSPARDSLSYEAQVMLSRAYSAVTAPEGVSERLGITRGRYNFLRLIYRAQARSMALGDVGRSLNVSLTNITKLTDGLVKDGLVRRVAHPQDKRMILAELTDEGVASFEQLLPNAMRQTETQWACLTDEEKRMLVHLLAKLRLNLLSNSSKQAMAQLRPTRPTTNRTALEGLGRQL
jgi:DNA-binding MarR family transcriptional regulator